MRAANQKKGRVGYYLLIVLLAGVLLFSGCQLYGYVSDVMAGQALAEELAEKAVMQLKPAGADDMPEGSAVENTVDGLHGQAAIYVNFETLLAEHEDIVAWLYCPDTPINYPVAQGEDNVQYLRHTLDGEYNIGGTLFADHRNAADMGDWNTVIYGHNMRTNTMFGSVSDYSSQEYYEAHPVWYLLTPEKDYEVVLFAGYVTTTDSVAYGFPMSREDKLAFVKSSVADSRFAADVAIGDEERLVTFSTCTAGSEDARYILVGVLRELSAAQE